MIIYGVYLTGLAHDSLFNMFADRNDAEAYIENRTNPNLFYIQEMQVY